MPSGRTACPEALTSVRLASRTIGKGDQSSRSPASSRRTCKANRSVTLPSAATARWTSRDRTVEAASGGAASARARGRRARRAASPPGCGRGLAGSAGRPSDSARRDTGSGMDQDQVAAVAGLGAGVEIAERAVRLRPDEALLARVEPPMEVERALRLVELGSRPGRRRRRCRTPPPPAPPPRSSPRASELSGRPRPGRQRRGSTGVRRWKASSVKRCSIGPRGRLGTTVTWSPSTSSSRCARLQESSMRGPSRSVVDLDAGDVEPREAVARDRR